MRLRSFGLVLAIGLGLAGVNGCAVGEVEEAWQRTHQSRSPDIAQWSGGVEAKVKGWLPGIHTLPAGYAEKMN